MFHIAVGRMKASIAKLNHDAIMHYTMTDSARRQSAVSVA